MKRMTFLVAIGLLVLLSGCVGLNERTASSAAYLQQAATSVASSPDSAFALLQKKAPDVGELAEEDRMYHHLLTIQVMELRYMVYENDSLINRVVAYYEKHADRPKLMLAYYLQGKVYRDMNDAPRALKAFRQALDVEAPEWKLRTEIYREMRTLFAEQGLYNEAIQTARKALETYALLEQPIATAVIRKDMARWFDLLGMNDSTVHYYRSACSQAMAEGDSAVYYSALAELVGLLYEPDNARSSIQTLKQVERWTDLPDQSGTYFLLGQIYKGLGQWDSAYYYNRKVIESGNIEKSYHSYRDLYAMEKRKGNYVKAFEYLEKALESRNLVQVITQTEAVARVNALYNYQHTESENHRLLLENERKQSHIYLLILAVFTALAGMVGVGVYMWRKRQQALLQTERLRVSQAKRRAEILADMRKTKVKMNKLEMQLADSQQQKNTLHSQLVATQNELLGMTEQQKEMIHPNHQVQDSLFQQTEICMYFQRAGKTGVNEVTSEHWKKLEMAIHSYYPMFVKRLTELYPSISSRELYVCYLIKSALSVKEMAIVLDCDISAVSKLRKRLYQKLTGMSGTAKDFDKIITDL